MERRVSRPRRLGDLRCWPCPDPPRLEKPLGWSASGAVALAVVGALVTVASPALLLDPFASQSGRASVVTGVPSEERGAPPSSTTPNSNIATSSTPTTKPSASSAPGMPQVVVDGNSHDLDPEQAASGKDLELSWTWGIDRPVFEEGLFARVQETSVDACRVTAD